MNRRALACVSLRVSRVNDYAWKKRKKRNGKRERERTVRSRYVGFARIAAQEKRTISLSRTQAIIFLRGKKAAHVRSAIQMLSTINEFTVLTLCVQRKLVIRAESVLSDNNVAARAHLAPIDYPRSAPFDSVDARRLRMSANRDNYSNFVTKSPVVIRASRRKSLAVRKDYYAGSRSIIELLPMLV